jgi:hypothetical protein
VGERVSPTPARGGSRNGARRARERRPTKTIRLAWSGRISGLGATALRDTNVRVRFSYFAGRALPAAPGFGWITDHVVRVN